MFGQKRGEGIRIVGCLSRRLGESCLALYINLCYFAITYTSPVNCYRGEYEVDDPRVRINMQIRTRAVVVKISRWELRGEDM